MSKTEKYIKRYGLKVVKIKKIDLKKLHYQYRPEIDGDRLLIDSPHFEIAKLYYIHGLKWVENNYDKTKYFLFQKDILLKDPHVPKGKIRLFDSLREGYLKKGHENDYIVVLKDPLVKTRYGVDIDLPLFEIFIGHHRAAALLALGKGRVDVILAKDNQIGTKNCYGNIHDIYKGVT